MEHSAILSIGTLTFLAPFLFLGCSAKLDSDAASDQSRATGDLGPGHTLASGGAHSGGDASLDDPNSVGGADAEGPLSSGGSWSNGGMNAGVGGVSTGGDASAGGTQGSTGGAGGTSPAQCSLTDSGPLTTTKNGQVIENLHITSSGARAIDIKHDDVIVRNVRISHSTGRGIYVAGDRVTIENVHVEFVGAPASGPNSTAGFTNIECNGSSDFTVTGARLERGSSGIYLVNCPDSTLSYLQGFDFRGPYPRGQLVQWNASSNGSLEDFSVVNPAGSWPEDNINVYKSQNVVIRRGLVDGNNAPSGVGVIFDGGTSTGLVEDVDAIHMGNGCFSGYAGASDVTFSRTRCSDNVCESQDDRGESKSGSLMWAGNPNLTGQKIYDSSYMNSCNGNISWPASAFSVRELEKKNYAPRAPLALKFCFD